MLVRLMIPIPTKFEEHRTLEDPTGPIHWNTSMGIHFDCKNYTSKIKILLLLPYYINLWNLSVENRVERKFNSSSFSDGKSCSRGEESRTEREVAPFKITFYLQAGKMVRLYKRTVSVKEYLVLWVINMHNQTCHELILPRLKSKMEKCFRISQDFWRTLP